MIRLMFGIFTLAALPAAALFAQDLTGTWQGTIHADDGDRREVVRISKQDKGFQAVLFSIDLAPGQSFPSNPFAIESPALKIEFPGIGAEYNGTVSADGNSITGKYTRGQAPLDLILRRATPETAWEIPAAPVSPKPMPPDAEPTFAIATIKLSSPDAQGQGMGPSPGGRVFSTRNTSLKDLIKFAYGVHVAQISGAPVWAGTDRYDIAVEPDADGAPSERQWKIILQKLMADRFRLKFHRASKELSVYEIRQSKPAPKLIRSTSDPNGGPALGGTVGSVNCRNAAVGDLAALLQSAVLDRPVLDRTALPGRYDFALLWKADEFQFAGLGNRRPPLPDDNDARPDLFTAMQQQLGLKLAAAKAKIEILVIDHAEKPSGN